MRTGQCLTVSGSPGILAGKKPIEYLCPNNEFSQFTLRLAIYDQKEVAYPVQEQLHFQDKYDVLEKT